MLAAVGTVLIAARINVWSLLTLGDLVALAAIPLWIGTLRRFGSARLIFGLGVLTIPVGAFLTALSSTDHVVRSGTLSAGLTLMVGMLAGLGFLLWARLRMKTSTLVILYGIGQLIGISSAGGLFASNPWKFGFSVPVTVIILGVTLAARRRGAELAAILALTTISAFTDARSSFAILLCTAALAAWQLRPSGPHRRASATRAVLGLVAIVVVVYNLGQALILSGLLGVATQQRSLRQLDEAGSLILGGRPEIAATLALIRDNVIGFGTGIVPNYHDVVVVKEAMSRLNYDPNNGYVENHMLGNGFALHSIFGDLWAQAGLVGLLFVLVLVIVIVSRLGQLITTKAATGIVLYLAIRSLWNIVFAPWYSSISLMVLLLALILAPRPSADPTVRVSDAPAVAPRSL